MTGKSDRTLPLNVVASSSNPPVLPGSVNRTLPDKINCYARPGYNGQPGPSPSLEGSTPGHYPIVRLNSKGPAVEDLQHKLNVVGGARLTEDGSFGSNTLNAVLNFQRFFKLVRDGIVGSATWKMLNLCFAHVT